MPGGVFEDVFMEFLLFFFSSTFVGPARWRNPAAGGAELRKSLEEKEEGRASREKRRRGRCDWCMDCFPCLLAITPIISIQHLRLLFSHFN
jgi:hypothetical protein